MEPYSRYTWREKLRLSFIRKRFLMALSVQSTRAPLRLLDNYDLKSDIHYSRFLGKKPFALIEACQRRREDVVQKLADLYERISTDEENYAKTDWETCLALYLPRSTSIYLILLRTGRRFFRLEKYWYFRKQFIRTFDPFGEYRDILTALEFRGEHRTPCSSQSAAILRFFIDFYVEKKGSHDVTSLFKESFKDITSGEIQSIAFSSCTTKFALLTLKHLKYVVRQGDWVKVLNKYITDIFPHEVDATKISQELREILKFIIREGVSFEHVQLRLLSSRNEFDIIYSFVEEGYKLKHFGCHSTNTFLAHLETFDNDRGTDMHKEIQEDSLLSLEKMCRIKLREINYFFKEDGNRRDQIICNVGKFHFYETPKGLDFLKMYMNTASSAAVAAASAAAATAAGATNTGVAKQTGKKKVRIMLD